MSNSLTNDIIRHTGDYDTSHTATNTGAVLEPVAGGARLTDSITRNTLINNGLIYAPVHTSGADYAVTMNTDSLPTITAPINIITAATTAEVTPGTSNYSIYLSISSSGTVISPDPTLSAIYFNDPFYIVGEGVPTITNAGTIAAPHANAVWLNGKAVLTNTGLIDGGLHSGGNADVINSGIITGGVSLYGGTISNTGTVSGTVGATVNLGLLINAGTIVGSSLALNIFTNGIVEAEPEGAFDGGIGGIGGLLLLAANTTGSLDLTGSVSSGTKIDFGAGSRWTLEGGNTALATGDTITNFFAGDTVVLDGFAATSETFNPTIGLVLSNSTAIETLNITDTPPNAAFGLSTNGGASTITAFSAPAGIISTTLATQVTPGYGAYGNTLSITSTGLLQAGLYGTPGVPSLDLTNSGTITNSSHYSILLDNPATLKNLGVIYDDISAKAGGIIINSGTIESFSVGIEILNGTIVNTGTIADTGRYPSSIGIVIASGVLTNNGIINATSGADAQYSSIDNTGIISGLFCGIYGSDNTITNSGVIYSYGGPRPIPRYSAHFQGYGISLSSGVVYNMGSISGRIGIYSRGDCRITTSGSISGGTDAIYTLGDLILTIDPGAVFNGNVFDHLGNGTIILAGTTAASLDMTDRFTGFSNFTFAAGSNWTLIGTTAELTGGQTISGFTAGDTIALTDFTAISGSYIIGTGLVLSNGTTTETLAVTGTPNISVRNGEVIANALCFARGTRIQASRRKIPVEKLKIGDTILTHSGAAATIKWIGQRSYDGRYIMGNHLALPVTIKRHALAKNIPSRDLTVSPGHGIFISNTLIPAWRLINGVTITQAEAVDRIDYFHIELTTHAVILAENCPSESYIDNGDRSLFQNAATAPASFPSTPVPRCEQGTLLEAIRTRLDLRAGLRPASVAAAGALRGYIDEASPQALRGWAQDLAHPNNPVSLDIFLDGRRHGTIIANQYRPDLRAAGIGLGCHGFALPGLPGNIELRRSSDAILLPYAPHAQAA